MMMSAPQPDDSDAVMRGWRSLVATNSNVISAPSALPASTAWRFISTSACGMKSFHRRMCSFVPWANAGARPAARMPARPPVTVRNCLRSIALDVIVTPPSWRKALGHERAAVAVEGRAGDVAALVATQEEHRRGQLVGARESPEGDLVEELGLALRGHAVPVALEHRPADREARDEAVDRDAVRAQLARAEPGQPEHRGL